MKFNGTASGFPIAEEPPASAGGAVYFPDGNARGYFHVLHDILALCGESMRNILILEG
ncbi:MAG: hypothetical protein IJW49_11730 [Clostridia bacterium]|nr:hypothetical protein [Clostridia bacterium]MBQ9807158.1 hypothetical protein [Clostridia bacterium]